MGPEIARMPRKIVVSGHILWSRFDTQHLFLSAQARLRNVPGYYQVVPGRTGLLVHAGLLGLRNLHSKSGEIWFRHGKRDYMRRIASERRTHASGAEAR